MKTLSMRHFHILPLAVRRTPWHAISPIATYAKTLHALFLFRLLRHLLNMAMIIAALIAIRRFIISRPALSLSRRLPFIALASSASSRVAALDDASFFKMRFLPFALYIVCWCSFRFTFDVDICFSYRKIGRDITIALLSLLFRVVALYTGRFSPQPPSWISLSDIIIHYWRL